MSKEVKNVHQKLLEARGIIRKTNLKKEGKNEYSNYEYFTPEQVSQLVSDACQETGLLTQYSLYHNDGTYTALLIVIDVDNPEDKISFETITAIPNLKATIVTQQIGGAMTYSERYLKKTAFDIQDNGLDPDSKDNRKKLNDAGFEKLIKAEDSIFLKNYKNYAYNNNQQKQVNARLDELEGVQNAV